MPQHGMKIKTKVPSDVKLKKKTKGPPITKRINKPIAPKKLKLAESQKLKKAITKNVNQAVEEELRAFAWQEGKRSGAPSSSAGKKDKKGDKG